MGGGQEWVGHGGGRGGNEGGACGPTANHG